ncbi:MAG: Primosomal protein N' [Phycisphaerae bacterium]|nr:Primosomal protein N' [Phycisphaerae bacterium]
MPIPDSPRPTLWAEEGEAKLVDIATVVPLLPIDRRFSFAIPEKFSGQVQPGLRVRAPFGRASRLLEGFVVECSRQPWNNTLKYLEELVDVQNWLEGRLLQLGEWMAEYYGHSLGPSLAAMVPPAVRARRGFRKIRQIWRTVEPAGPVEGSPRLGPKMRQLLQHLPVFPQSVAADEFCRQHQISLTTLRQAIKRGWAGERVEKIPAAVPDFDEPVNEPQYQLNAEQQAALEQVKPAVDHPVFRVFLLYGVSGSGKTEVYIHALQQVLSSGRQVIIMVPEIALTTQLVHRFASRLRQVAVLHSGLTDVQRSLIWNALRSGEKQVVIGTRSAIFAPCPRLGMIVVDEEQEGSFKNQQAPRYHARDVAIKRAQLENIPIILGSATPALESWQHAHDRPHYQLLTLSRRVANLELPLVELVDMRQEERRYHDSIRLISQPLEIHLRRVLEQSEQAVLLLNRRGYARVLKCTRCRERVLCPRCRATLVLHQSGQTLLCHHCYFRSAIPAACADPSCGGRLLATGPGTERIEEEVQRLFPTARVRRVDSDTMVRVADYEQVLAAFARREFDVMVGTQMVAKGLDFPLVSLVGVIEADAGLQQPDFRAGERTFQLVTQVAGRAGRAQAGGRVVVQSALATWPVFIHAARHDYTAFAERELALRRQLHWPPFTRLVRWVISDPSESQARADAQIVAQTITTLVEQSAMTEVEILGPNPCAIERIRRLYRFDVILRCQATSTSRRIIHELRVRKLLKLKSRRLIIDVDPVALL